MPDVPLSEILLEQSPACHWLVTASGIFHKIYGDPSCILGKPAPELLGRKVTEVLDPDAAAIWKGRFAQALRGETLTLRERCGEARWNVSIFPIRVEGKIRYAGAMARESTQWAKAEQELRYTVLGALKAQEFERAMVSKFLHDAVGQNLTALGLQLDLVRMDLESISPASCAHIAEVQKLLGTMMEEVREYSYELNPSTVERAGLRSALDRLAARVRERFTGAIRLNVDPSLKIDPKLASALYQIAQEAVENAVQHSSCSLIEIAVKSTRNTPILEVRDNGRGFDPGDLAGGCRGLGLLSMEHYAAQAGLELSITSDRSTGTVVRAAAGTV
ncbi:Histidine kinase [Candidatus Sulfopaludibacter sp. SbA3]|nr:Histidine kinase [Candidatus Sulfopaludibacter sp. SbA3]